VLRLRITLLEGKAYIYKDVCVWKGNLFHYVVLIPGIEGAAIAAGERPYVVMTARSSTRDVGEQCRFVSRCP
jgi:hypothetical protein